LLTFAIPPFLRSRLPPLSATRRRGAMAALTLAALIVSCGLFPSHAGTASLVLLSGVLCACQVHALVTARLARWQAVVATYRFVGAHVWPLGARMLGMALLVPAQICVLGAGLAGLAVAAFPAAPGLTGVGVVIGAGIVFATGIVAGARSVWKSCRVPLPVALASGRQAGELMARFYLQERHVSARQGRQWDGVPLLQRLFLLTFVAVERDLGARGEQDDGLSGDEALRLSALLAYLPETSLVAASIRGTVELIAAAGASVEAVMDEVRALLAPAGEKYGDA